MDVSGPGHQARKGADHRDEIVDSTAGFVGEHLRRYLESDGVDGHVFHGISTLLLTTRGRRSGRLRRTPLIYGRVGDEYAVVASNGGSVAHPLWFENLTVDPSVTVQVGAQIFEASARTASADERVELWPMMAAIFPRYDEYQASAGRQIPVVLLSPRAS